MIYCEEGALFQLDSLVGYHTSDDIIVSRVNWPYTANDIKEAGP